MPVRQEQVQVVAELAAARPAVALAPDSPRERAAGSGRRSAVQHWLCALPDPGSTAFAAGALYFLAADPAWAAAANSGRANSSRPESRLRPASAHSHALRQFVARTHPDRETLVRNKPRMPGAKKAGGKPLPKVRTRIEIRTHRSQPQRQAFRSGYPGPSAQPCPCSGRECFR